jgi:HSP20 family molecular chaperone IbpA
MAIMKNTVFMRNGSIAIVALVISACSTVRDTTDWIPGVDSNEEVQVKEQQQVKKVMAKEREDYIDKEAFAPLTQTASELDAKISVQISQKYQQSKVVNPEDVGIEVNAGVVTLTGNVNSDDSAISAISIAKSTRGVTRVVSKLVVIKVRSQQK